MRTIYLKARISVKLGIRPRCIIRHFTPVGITAPDVQMALVFLCRMFIQDSKMLKELYLALSGQVLVAEEEDATFID
jgi:hypothetical protein